jgi:hypothetical protein
LPDFLQPFEVVFDAARTPPALGAALLQSGSPIACFSLKLSGAELNYYPPDIEMLANGNFCSQGVALLLRGRL